MRDCSFSGGVGNVSSPMISVPTLFRPLVHSRLPQVVFFLRGRIRVNIPIIVENSGARAGLIAHGSLLFRTSACQCAVDLCAPAIVVRGMASSKYFTVRRRW